MIIIGLLEVLVAIASALFSLVPTVSLPSFFGDLEGYGETLGTQAAGFGYWLPLSAVTTVVTGLLAVLGISVAIRVARRVVSLLSGGGGA